jgi:hypothetical protein
MLWINRVLQGTKSAFPYVVFAILVVEFIITFPLMLYPPIAISMVLVGIFSLIALVFVYKILCMVVHWYALRVLRTSVCARCEAHTIEAIHHEARMQPIARSEARAGPLAAEPMEGFRCGHCRTVFSADGGVYNPDHHPLDIAIPTQTI